MKRTENLEEIYKTEKIKKFIKSEIIGERRRQVIQRRYTNREKRDGNVIENRTSRENIKELEIRNTMQRHHRKNTEIQKGYEN